MRKRSVSVLNVKRRGRHVKSESVKIVNALTVSVMSGIDVTGTAIEAAVVVIVVMIVATTEIGIAMVVVETQDVRTIGDPQAETRVVTTGVLRVVMTAGMTVVMIEETVAVIHVVILVATTRLGDRALATLVGTTRLALRGDATSAVTTAVVTHAAMMTETEVAEDGVKHGKSKHFTALDVR